MAADPTLADEAFLLGRAAWHRAKADDMSDVRDAHLHRTHHIGLAGRMEEIAVRLRKLDAIEEAVKWYGGIEAGVQPGWDDAAYDEVSELLRRIADALGGTET